MKNTPLLQLSQKWSMPHVQVSIKFHHARWNAHTLDLGFDTPSPPE